MRPRRPRVSDDAPMIATDFGQSSFAMSGIQRRPSPRAMMPRSTSVVPPWMVSLGAIMVAKRSCSSSVARLPSVSSMKARELAHAVRQLLLPDRAHVLHDRAFDHRLLAGLQHAVHRDRHAPQRVQLRDQPAEPLGAAHIRLVAQRAHQLDQHIERLEETLRPASARRRARWSPASRRRRSRRAHGRPA